ncbi:MAG: hypothetical protein AB7P23_08595 [Amphiplicatus sp.]
MSASLLKLERFDAPDAGPDEAIAAASGNVFEQRLRAEAFAEGFAAGQAAAAREAGEQGALANFVAAAIEGATDLLSQNLTHDAGAALKSILERIFPVLAEKGFAAEAAVILTNAAKNSGGRILEISAPPDKTEALERLLNKSAPGASFSVKPDSTLKGAVARAVWLGGGLDVDLDQAASECLAALEAALNELESERRS